MIFLSRPDPARGPQVADPWSKQVKSANFSILLYCILCFPDAVKYFKSYKILVHRL